MPVALTEREERQLPTSSKILEAYPSPPMFKPMEKSTPESRRRSRDLSSHLGSMGDIRESDPIFVLRKVGPRGLAGAMIDGLKAPALATPLTSATLSTTSSGPRSPAEIIAAQRAASRSRQLSILSKTNKSEGVDVVLPSSQGTFRSTKQVDEKGSRVMRYSYIDEGGEMYDISELLEQEWGKGKVKAIEEEGEKEEFGMSLVGNGKNGPPGLLRQMTDTSNYYTAPSTPQPGADLDIDEVEILDDSRPRSLERSEEDLLQTAVQRASQDGQSAGLEEALKRVLSRVKEGSSKGSTGPEDVVRSQNGTPNGRVTPQQVSSMKSLNIMERMLRKLRPWWLTHRLLHAHQAISINRTATPLINLVLILVKQTANMTTRRRASTASFLGTDNIPLLLPSCQILNRTADHSVLASILLSLEALVMWMRTPTLILKDQVRAMRRTSMTAVPHPLQLRRLRIPLRHSVEELLCTPVL